MLTQASRLTKGEWGEVFFKKTTSARQTPGNLNIPEAIDLEKYN